MSYVQVAAIPMINESWVDVPVTNIIKGDTLTKTKIEIIKLRKILEKTDSYFDIIESAWFTEHPSIGKSDKVVWEYELVRDEFNIKYRGYQ